MEKDYSYQCNYCISRSLCLDRPKVDKCNLYDNEQYFKECIYTYGNYYNWKDTFKLIKKQQEENMFGIK